MKEKEGTKTVERVEVFNYGENAPVRVRVIKGQTWFVAKDVCKVLEFSDAEAATRLLDDDEKLNLLVVGSGQRRNMIHISESGLYHLLLQSRKPKAKPFRRWVTMEVLPSIRERGYYGTGHGDVRRCGVEGMLYRGMRLYPYRELLKALGMSARSGSACRRRRMWPAFFVRAFGRDFVTEQLADLLEDERRVQRRREAMRGWQLELEFKAGCDPPAGAGDQRAQAPQIYREKRFF